MKTKNLLLLFAALLLIPLAASADIVEIDSIYYSLDADTEQAVVTRNPNKYSGSVNIPSTVTDGGVSYSVTFIGGSAFYGCSGLTSVTIPNSITSIGGWAFSDCSSLTSVTIGNSVTSIGDGAFCRCTSLTSINIPNSVTSIGRSAFDNCSSLTSVTIGNSVTSIGRYAFCGCSGLTSVTIPNSVTSIGGSAFNGCSGLTSVIIPNSVTSIESEAFADCSSLTSVTIPNSVTSIGSSAFRSCSGLTSITIPNSVTSIGNYAFRECSDLTEVRSMIEKPFAIDNGVFLGLPAEATLYVPYGTKALYEATDGWKNFANIVEMEPEVLKPVNDGDNVDYGEGGGITEGTDLSGTVVDNMFYSIGTDAGGFSSEEGCIVITKETSEEQMEALAGLGITDEELNQNFTGIIFVVPAGSGTITVNAETTGDMTLKVKVGDGQTVEMEQSGRLKMKFPYNVTEETMVYIFASTASGARAMSKAGGESCVKIYGIKIDRNPGTATDISDADRLTDNEPAEVYDLSGRKVNAQMTTGNSTLKKGVNIIRTNDGRVIKKVKK